MRVLVACEFSGVVRRAFRERGHDAWSCDLLPAEDGSEFHIQDSALNHLIDGWDLMIGHPPCTYLTNAGVRHLHPEVSSRLNNRASVYGEARWVEMEQGAAFFIALKTAPIPKIALENPTPHKYARWWIGPYQQKIQPWEFGHEETKATCLWLKNLPPLMASIICEKRERKCHMTPPSKDRWKIRSRTYAGIAAAMAEQWGTL